MASDAERAVDTVAASVADGASIDWERSSVGLSDRERRLISHLRVVDAVSQVYRSLPAFDPGNQDDERGASTEPAGPRWGRLVLLDRIGRGSSADVFRAWDVDLQREVALKLLVDDGVTADDAANARMLREARRLARVRHSHVVHIYGAERHEGRVGLWMELVRGRTLAEIVQAEGPLSAVEAASAAADVCGAVSAVHAAGLLHRDIKAQNVVRDDSGRLVLMDFGAGVEIGSRPSVAGTPIYIAPEVLSGSPATVASDIYSIGVLLFFLMSGRYPVEGASLESLIAAHRAGRRVALTGVVPAAPLALRAIVERALERNPAKRFGSVAEMEAALRGFLNPAVRASGASSWRTWAAVVTTAAAVAALVATVANRKGTPAAPAAPATSIAVLPLTYASQEASAPLIADGLTDELITKLGQVPSLRVTAHTSVRRFKATDRPVADIASELHVGSVLEGSVGVDGPDRDRRVHVNLRLIRAGTDIELWSNSFDRPLGDLVTIEAEIARAVTRSVHAALTRDDTAKLQRARATTAAAEQAYLEGRAHLSQFAARATDALAAFQRAIAADPLFAPAYAGAARAYVALGFDGAVSQSEARAGAAAETRRALQLDADLPEAHGVQADLYFYYDWDYDAAEQEYQAALSLDPSASYTRAQHAQFLAALRRLDQAILEADESVSRDPLSAQAELTRALILFYARRYDDALASTTRAASLDPSLPTTRFLRGRIYEAKGDIGTALRETNAAIATSGTVATSWRIQSLRLRALLGDSSGARAGLAALKAGPEANALDAGPQEAYLRIVFNEPDAALAILERASANRDPSLLWIDVDPRLDAIRTRPEFLGLRRRLRLP